MKRDFLILLGFLAVTLVSGGVIFIMKNPPADVTAEPQASPSVDKETQLRIQELEETLKRAPEDFDALVNLGNLYYDANEPQKAIIYYERGLLLKPDSPGVLVDCGAMFRQLGDPDRAIEYFNKAIMIEPHLPQAYFNLGAVLRIEKADAVGAANAWKKYLELDPNPDPEIKKLLENEISAALGL